MQPGHGSGPLAQALLRGSVLLGALEHDLHAHADPQDRAPAGQALLNEARSIDCPQLVHHRTEGPDTGDNQSVGLSDLVGVTGQSHLGANTLQSAYRRTDIAGSVGQDGDA